MLYDGKSLPIGRVVPDRVWNQVRPLLELPEYTRDDFDKIVAKYFQDVERRNRVKAAPSIKEFIWSDWQKRGLVFSYEVFGDAVFFMTLGLYKHVYGRTFIERGFVSDLAEFIHHHTGDRPNHGKKWLPKLIEVCALIDPEITPGTIEGALRGHRNRLSR